MKATLKFLSFILCFMMVTSFMVACGKEDTENTESAEVTVTTAALETFVLNDDPVGEGEAKEVALTDAGIPETAAENLKVEMTTVDSVDVYIVSFEWSGFSYTYTIDAVGGVIIDSTFE